MKTEGHHPGLEGPEGTLPNVTPLTQENINHSEKGASKSPLGEVPKQMLEGSEKTAQWVRAQLRCTTRITALRYFGGFCLLLPLHLELVLALSPALASTN